MLTLKKIKPYLLIIAAMVLVSSCKILQSKPKAAIEQRHFKESIYTKKIIQTARTYTGVPYRSGGNDDKGLDCSGLICQTFKEVGIKLPRISWQQAEYFPAIDLPNIQKGDLVFFVTSGKNISHAGIVTEIKSENDIRFIHASSSKGVIEDNMMITYWKARFARVCRPQFNDLANQ